MIRLSPEAEPEIYATTRMFGTVSKRGDARYPGTRFRDTSLAENSRGATRSSSPKCWRRTRPGSANWSC